ncbi:hypothetical protein FRC0513_00733 [Corynebacterium diphtheriae]|nr:hypothetical protein FRC0084_00710 [Corynebacterium diphtheriae]CAB0854177.1 hypothetical protein FRC0356_00705 [Corynebacterium diphtheriae]CAB0987101.1 hypothetical protein FRC0513_00733 [Corynebacterium diphtheriae]
MADRKDVIVYADGGDMTVGRSIPVYVLGAFDVVLPEGREQEKEDDRVRNGYIYRPPTPAAGSLDVGFVKADVKLDFGAKTSSLERVVDAAIRRTEGDVFFERDIYQSGLGGFTPGRDFDLHDVIQVDVWGKLLPSPVTAIDYEGSVSQRSLAARVHVGGQMITDAEGLQAKTDATLERVEAEKRQRLKSIGAVSKQAASAGTAAAKADGKAVAARETADDALAKWRQQKDQLDAFQSQQIEKNRELASETSRLAKAIDRRATGMIFLERDKTVYSTTHGMGMYMPRTNRWALVVATPPFTGTAVVDYYYSGGSVVPFSMGKADFELVEDWKSWSYRDSYYGARFDPLMDAQGRMLIKWIKVEIGDVRAAKLTVDKIDWS